MQRAFELVCMFENPLPVIENETYTLKHTRSIFIEKPNTTSRKRLFVIYVCLQTLCLSWKMKHTRSNTNSQTLIKFMKNQRNRYPYRGFVMLSYKTIIIQKALEHVCMFENPLPVMENETYTLKHTRAINFD